VDTPPEKPPMIELTELTEAELVVLAGLGRAMTRIDGRVTAEEQEAVLSLRLNVSEGVAKEGSPYRGRVGTTPLEPDRWRTLLERAGETLDTEEKLQEAAMSVTRPEAREAIFALVAEIAIVDAVGTAEWRALEWLEERWDLRAEPAR
jgi:hypothetical protein